MNKPRSKFYLDVVKPVLKIKPKSKLHKIAIETVNSVNECCRLNLEKTSEETANKILDSLDKAKNNPKQDFLCLDDALDSLSNWYSEIINDYWDSNKRYYAEATKNGTFPDVFFYATFKLFDIQIKSLKKALDTKSFDAIAGLWDYNTMGPYKGKGKRKELVGTNVKPIAALYSKRRWLDKLFQLYKEQYSEEEGIILLERNKNKNLLLAKPIELEILNRELDPIFYFVGYDLSRNFRK